MKQKYNKLLLLVLIIIIILTIFYEFIMYPKEVAIFGDNTIIYYINNRLVKIDHPDKINYRYNFNKFLVYNDGNFEEGYLNNKEENGYSYFEVYMSDFSKKYMNPVIAYTKELDLNIYISKESNDYTQSELKKIQEVLSENNLDNKYTNISKKETKNMIMYNINNYKIESERYYNIVFLLDANGKVNIIDKSYYDKNTVSGKKYNFFGQVDIDKDGTDEIAITETQGDDSPTYYYFYKYDSSTGILSEIN